MKKITYTLAASLTIMAIILAQSSMHVFADYTLGGQNVLNQATRIQNQASRSATRQANQLQNIINRANTMIDNRLSSLNTLMTRVQNDAQLSSDVKSTLSSEIQTDITGLTALKTKIDADTDVTTARSDTKTIVTSYYVYAVFIPKTRLLITLNDLQTTTVDVQALVTQLQTLINTLQSEGKNTSQLTPLISDISTQVQTINTNLSTDITTVSGVSTTSESGASSTFKSVRQNISQIVKKDFSKIRSDFSQMRSIFKQILGNMTPTVNPGGTDVNSAPSAAVTTAPTSQTSPSPSQ